MFAGGYAAASPEWRHIGLELAVEDVLAESIAAAVHMAAAGRRVVG